MRAARGAADFTLSPHAVPTWLLFIDSQGHWRHGASGHLEALDVTGFATLLDRQQRAADAEDWATLADMWTAQRVAINERLNDRLAALNK